MPRKQTVHIMISDKALRLLRARAKQDGRTVFGLADKAILSFLSCGSCDPLTDGQTAAGKPSIRWSHVPLSDASRERLAALAAAVVGEYPELTLHKLTWLAGKCPDKNAGAWLLEKLVTGRLGGGPGEAGKKPANAISYYSAAISRARPTDAVFDGWRDEQAAQAQWTETTAAPSASLKSDDGIPANAGRVFNDRPDPELAARIKQDYVRIWRENVPFLNNDRAKRGMPLLDVNNPPANLGEGFRA